MILVGLESTVPGSVGRCLIHWATGPLGKDFLHSCQPSLTKKAVLGIEPRTSCSLNKNHATRPSSQLMWGSRRPLVSARAKNTCAGHLWKVGLENDLALAILAMKTFALTADYLLPGKFFGGHLGEGRSNVISSKSTFQWAKLCFKGAFDFPLPGLPLPGKSLRAISPRCFQAAFF